MKYIKKSANINPDVLQALENVLSKNPGVSFSLAVNEALKAWCKAPKVELNRAPATEDDVDRFLKENSELMDDLGK